MKGIAILGSTGSIGRSALAVIDACADRLQVVALGAGENTALLAEQCARHRPRVVAVATEAARADLEARLATADRPAEIAVGREGLLAVATAAGADIVLCATSGTAGLEAVLAAIDAGRTIALANKEVLVMAGALVMDAARRRGVAILPVDSEHHAIYQCLHGRRRDEWRRLVLTASGGPFRNVAAADLARVTPEDALKHPTWRMGRKITIDSATLMNKGLEVIEAHWLFGASADEIGVVIHPQSIVHSLVEFHDGSMVAQLGVTDMRLPIQYAFSHPDRWSAGAMPFDLTRAGALEFFAPDTARFPCLSLAYEALRAGGAAPIVLNGANEAAVEAFLAGAIGFPDIPAVIAHALAAPGCPSSSPASLGEVRDVDRWAKAISADTISTLRSR